jgi:tetratricopeptide (TPR) repeat protein
MSNLPQDRWPQVEAIVDEALDLRAEDRAAFVRDACGADGELLAAVHEWLAACDDPSLVPDTPAAIFAASLLTTGARRPEISEIGPYRIVRELGRGGMGTVYLGERADGELDRRVAVKLMRRGTADDAGLRRRFRDERQILARLEHPQIVTLIDGGVTPEGRLYFVMQYVEGVPIDRYCDEHRLPVDERLRLFLSACGAVQYAHRHQVVHRDLKPGNILVTTDGQVKLLDFGIAKLIEPESSRSPEQTRTGERLLTPEYASPEQIRGDPVTPASDVHALGVLLHRLLTGQRPFHRVARSAYELEKAILDEEPTQPSDAVTDPAERRRLRGDLDAIVLTALRKDPAHRYADAGQLADDLERHLRGLPVRARGRAPAYRLRKFVQRHRGVAAAAVAGTVLGAVALASLSRNAGDADAGRPVLAIGRIADYRGGANADGAGPLVDMLATNLARTQGLTVVSAGRMYELMPNAANDPSDAAWERSARLTGATELVSGAIYPTGGGVRLDLRRVDLASGTILGAYSTNGPDLFALADSATTQLVTALGLVPPSGSIADVTTSSLVAYNHYMEGLRHYLAGRTTDADSALIAALRIDSSFAMAAFYLARNSQYQWRFVSATSTARAEFQDRITRALRLAEKASDRERLLIRAYYAAYDLSPAMGAIAETLAVRYPQEVDGHFMFGLSLTLIGEPGQAVPHFERVVSMDSASLRSKAVACAACMAIDALIDAHMMLDSLGEAKRLARVWLGIDPGSIAARSRLIHVLDGEGRYAEATDVLRGGAFAGGAQDSVLSLAKHWIRAGELSDADSLLRGAIQRTRGSAQAPLLFFHAMVLRDQGRLREALVVTRRLRAISGERMVAGAVPPSAMFEAQVLLELGQPREAAALFGAIGRWPATGQSASVQATQRVQALSMMAASLHAAGDTGGLAVLADSLERDGKRSLMFRPRDQHHFVRGLLLEARGDDDAAIAEFGRALSVAASDFGRANLALATLHLKHNRPEKAIAVLQPAVRGWFLESTNLHVSLTELHESLAQAHEAAGARDSAAVHWQRVTRSWARADPQFAKRLSSPG